jgi:hypothetical protein
MVHPPLSCDTGEMHDYPIDPRDEERHEPTGERFWSESYYFDFHDEQGSLGGYVRIGLYPNLGVTWQWAALVGAGRPLVTAINHHAPVPAPGTLEVSCPGLKADHECRSPNQRFGVIVEASAVALQDPAQVYGSMEGKATPLAFDLEWETDGPGGYRFRQMTRYEISCRVRGRIRVGDERIEFAGYGQRDHSWGVRDWWTMPYCWNAGRLEDGTRFHSVAPRTLDGGDMPFAAGYVQAPGEELVGIESSRAREELGTHGFPVKGRIEVGDLHLDLSPLYFAPVLMVDPDGRVARFPRCLARFFHADGRRGLGWIEWNQIQPQRSPA